MIVDDIKITVTAGHGGRGMVAFSKIKGMKGPMGGNGGNGGNIFSHILPRFLEGR